MDMDTIYNAILHEKLYELDISNKVIWLRWIFFTLCEKLIQHCWSFDKRCIKLFPSYRSAYHLVHEMHKAQYCIF